MSKTYEIKITLDDIHDLSNPQEALNKADRSINLIELDSRAKAIVQNFHAMSPYDHMYLLQYLSDRNALDFTVFMALNGTYMDVVNTRMTKQTMLDMLEDTKDKMDQKTYQRLKEDITNGK